MSQKQKRVAIITLAVALIAPLGTSAASAAPNPLETCIAAAAEKGATQWTCLGGTLTYTTPAESSSGRDAGHLAEADPTWETEVIVPDVASAAPAPATDIMPMGNGDEWDTWCEVGTTCTRTVNSYISETKGNVAYGNQNGAVGTYDLILKTNLNGGQARYNVGINHDSGPLITVNATVNCVWDKLFDGSCGHISVGQVYVGNFRSKLLYANRVTSAGTYFSTITGTATPDGAPSLPIPTLQSAKFTCSSVSNCTF